MSQKINSIQFKRNKTIYQSFAELVTAVKSQDFLANPEIATMKDGELIMFRYKDTTGNIATLVGSVYNPDSSTKEIHLEIGTDKIKKIIQEELKNIGDNQSKITINSADKILSLGSDNTLTANLNLVKSGDTLKLIGKNNLVISTITLPKSESTIDSLSFNWLPQEAKLQLISNDNVLSEVDFPFETMVQSSELTTDNKLKLVFNTAKGPQSVIVDLNKLKDIYTAGDSTISVTGNKISTKVSSKTTSLPITKETDGLWVNDAKLTETVNDLNSLKTKVSNLEAESGSGKSESNKPKNPTGVNLLFNDTTEFNANSKILQNLNNHPHFYELPLKPITLYQANQVFTFSFSPNEITQIMSGSLNIVLVNSDNKPIPIEIFNPDNLTFNETGWIIGKNNDTITIDLEKMDNLFQTTDSIYSKMGKLFVSFITRGNIEYKIAKLVLNNPGGNNNHIDCFFGDIILEIGAIPSDYSIKRLEFQTVKNRFTNNITLLENKIKKIENNPVSSGDSTIEVTNNKISTKISKTGSYIPLVKKDDGLWVDDSDYNTRTSNLTNRITNIETSVKNGLTPPFVPTSENAKWNYVLNCPTAISDTDINKLSIGSIFYSDNGYKEFKNKLWYRIEPGTINGIVSEEDCHSIASRTDVRLQDVSVLRFYYHGGEDISKVANPNTPFLEYLYQSSSGKNLLSISKYNLNGKKQKLVDLVTKQDLAEELSKLNTGGTSELTLDKLKPLLDQYHSIVNDSQYGITSNALSFYTIENIEHAPSSLRNKNILIRRQSNLFPNKTITNSIFLGNIKDSGEEDPANGAYLLNDKRKSIFTSLKKTIYYEKFYLGIDPSKAPYYEGDENGDNVILKVYADLLPEEYELWDFLGSLSPNIIASNGNLKTGSNTVLLPERMVFKYNSKIYYVTTNNGKKYPGITYEQLKSCLEIYNQIHSASAPSQELKELERTAQQILDQHIVDGNLEELQVIGYY